MFATHRALLAAAQGEKKLSGKETPQPTEDKSLRKWFSSFGGGGGGNNIARADEVMCRKWGPPNSETYQIAMRYIVATRMKKYWEAVALNSPGEFQKRVEKGYLEPIPLAWVQYCRLAQQYPEGSRWETPAEKRLYYVLNNAEMPEGVRRPPRLQPLNITRNRAAILRRGMERNARQVQIDANKLAAYQSKGDVFHSDKQIQSHTYSLQVPNTITPSRQQALHALADGILHGTDHLETMILIDVSGSMTWNPHEGVIGPDGIVRFHDQPSNIVLVQHLVHRVLHHMVARAQREHPGQDGIDTVTFSTYGNYIGRLSAADFASDWSQKVRLGGTTQVMQGWQAVKNRYFEYQNQNYGHGRKDPVYGWQPTPGMPKLSLLVFLDGEAMDMDEFELELLGETWAYVTIALVGMENCPHHHNHAVELERVALFNPHVGFFDVHGRVCERLVVEDLLGSVYPVDPPAYNEILTPKFDLPPNDQLPTYSA
ncbi:hypothetical protein DFH07DRAFT_835644 [Mycena maculata]|uniref:VWFA domain-containing protein n=1 Tax=Mycena maculata TaxID=230809 RepID=A0AAD7IJG4_9AGAR|nr:hypothetical protein DFH07DRAFT_835644 [Mycena maculata]